MHDIPVGVIPRRLWNDFREPSVPDFDVSHCFIFLKGMGGCKWNAVAAEYTARGEVKGKREAWRPEL